MNIIKLEKLSINAWPSLQTTLCDGWILRFANGYGRRPNSVNPIYPSTEENYDSKIAYCEKSYLEKGLKPTFKLTAAVYPKDLDNMLEAKGYEKEGFTFVQTSKISELNTFLSKDLDIQETLTDYWVNHYKEAIELPECDVVPMTRILLNISLKPHYYTLFKEDVPVAFGLTIIEENQAGLFDIVVKKEYRGKGYGDELVQGILAHLKSLGVDSSYLQVVASNAKAQKLYQKYGYKTEYEYWYRVKY